MVTKEVVVGGKDIYWVDEPDEEFIADSPLWEHEVRLWRYPSQTFAHFGFSLLKGYGMDFALIFLVIVPLALVVTALVAVIVKG